MIANIAAAVMISLPTLTGTSASSICSQLDAHPTVKTVEDIVFDLFYRGYDSEDAAKYLVGSVAGNCPEYLPVLQAFAEKWG